MHFFSNIFTNKCYKMMYTINFFKKISFTYILKNPSDLEIYLYTTQHLYVYTKKFYENNLLDKYRI